MTIPSDHAWTDLAKAVLGMVPEDRRRSFHEWCLEINPELYSEAAESLMTLLRAFEHSGYHKYPTIVYPEMGKSGYYTLPEGI